MRCMWGAWILACQAAANTESTELATNVDAAELRSLRGGRGGGGGNRCEKSCEDTVDDASIPECSDESDRRLWGGHHGDRACKKAKEDHCEELCEAQIADCVATDAQTAPLEECTGVGRRLRGGRFLGGGKGGGRRRRRDDDDKTDEEKALEDCSDAMEDWCEETLFPDDEDDESEGPPDHGPPDHGPPDHGPPEDAETCESTCEAPELELPECDESPDESDEPAEPPAVVDTCESTCEVPADVLLEMTECLDGGRKCEKAMKKWCKQQCKGLVETCITLNLDDFPPTADLEACEAADATEEAADAEEADADDDDRRLDRGRGRRRRDEDPCTEAKRDWCEQNMRLTGSEESPEDAAEGDEEDTVAVSSAGGDRRLGGGRRRKGKKNKCEKAKAKWCEDQCGLLVGACIEVDAPTADLEECSRRLRGGGGGGRGGGSRRRRRRRDEDPCEEAMQDYCEQTVRLPVSEESPEDAEEPAEPEEPAEDQGYSGPEEPEDVEPEEAGDAEDEPSVVEMTSTAAPPTTVAPTEPPTTMAPESEPPTTMAPESEPPTTAAPESAAETSDTEVALASASGGGRRLDVLV